MPIIKPNSAKVKQVSNKNPIIQKGWAMVTSTKKVAVAKIMRAMIKDPVIVFDSRTVATLLLHELSHNEGIASFGLSIILPDICLFQLKRSFFRLFLF